MKFTPRFTAPSLDNENYISDKYGGKNGCLIINTKTGSVLPNCTGYAWGRFMEILGSIPNLSTGDAGGWYNYPYDGYLRGRQAQIGAVICWSQPGAEGHVAIVEQINSDGSIVVSESGYYTDKRFWTSTISSDYKISGYTFQGFIYNPACSGDKIAFNNFMDVVYNSVVTNTDDLISAFGISKNTNWNALFPGYCAKLAGASAIIPTKSSATDLVKGIIQNCGGIWHRGPHLGDNSYKPNVGDIICIVYKNQKTSDEYYTDRVAIVVDVQVKYINYYLEGMQDSPTPAYDVQVIEGDESGVAIRKIYSPNKSYINGYVELDWSRLNTTRASSPYVRGSLYDDSNDSNDALLREIAYVGIQNQPLINMTDIKLSVINYTSVLASFFEYAQSAWFNNLISDNDGYETQQYIFNNPMTYGGNDSSALRTNGKIIFDEFIRQGLPASAAVGIMSYMWAESRWNADAYNTWEDQPDRYRGRGLCQWSLERAVRFEKYVPQWRTNVTGQVVYCVTELKVSYKSLYEYLLSLKNTMQDAINAAKKFTLVFGAGQSFDLTISEGEFRFKAWYGDTNWNPHIEPAQYMWEHNISTILLSNWTTTKF